MSDSTRAKWGAARVAVAAKWEAIKVDLDARWPMIDVYRRHFADSGITYSGFRRQVVIFLQAKSEAVQPELSELTAPALPQGNPNAGSTSRTFDYKPSITSEDEERLAGR